MKCLYCGLEIISKTKRVRLYCSSICGAKHASQRARKRAKLRGVELLGGRCSKCGYNKCLAALEFHHTDPSTKDPSITPKGTYSWERLELELRKCILVCANCHREIHSEVSAIDTSLELELSRSRLERSSTSKSKAEKSASRGLETKRRMLAIDEAIRNGDASKRGFRAKICRDLGVSRNAVEARFWAVNSAARIPS